jgi:SAM-dependent methyltransferase
VGTVGTWLDFWNGSHRIYVNERHRTLHYRKIADDIIALLPGPDATVVDWGCGDALSAPFVAARAGRLILCDRADATRARLEARFAGEAGIVVASPEALRRDHAGAADLIIVNSVLQYLDEAALADLFADARLVLKPGGALIIADVIPPEDDMLGDIRNLLGLAWRNGFFLAACGGLVATWFSPYRKLRASIGLARHARADMLARLQSEGFTAAPLRPNLGFDQRRMAFRAIRP